MLNCRFSVEPVLANIYFVLTVRRYTEGYTPLYFSFKAEYTAIQHIGGIKFIPGVTRSLPFNHVLRLLLFTVDLHIGL